MFFFHFDNLIHFQGASGRDYSQHTNKENNFSFFDQNDETNVKKTQLNETFDIFNVNNLKEEKNESVILESASRAPERVTDKLLALLKSNSNVTKVEPVKKINIDQNDKYLNGKEVKWNEVNDEFFDRLAYLKDIQSAAAEESAQLLKQLKELKLREEPIPRK